MSVNKHQHHSRPWRGYTMEELQYQRAVTLIHIDVEKERIAGDYNRMSQGNFFMSASMFRRVLGALNYADYIVIVIKLWRKLAPAFSKKK